MLLVMEEHRKRAGQRLVRLREARGWNQEELAHHAGVSAKTVSRFENGRHDGRRDTIRKLAAALDVDEQGITGPPPAPLGLDATGDVDDVAALRQRVEDLHDKLDRVLSLLASEGLEDLGAHAARRAPAAADDERTSPVRRVRRSRATG